MVTKLVMFPKNGPTWWTSPRLVSPESSPPKRDTPFVIIWSSFLQEKNTKSEQNEDFVILCDHQLFQHDHVQFTFEDPRILQNPHQSLNYVFGKYTKNTKTNNIFCSPRIWKTWSFLSKTCLTWWASRRIVRQNNQIPFDSNFVHFLWKS